MGRPLIYICAVTIVVLGIIQINLNDRHIALAKRTVYYANGSEMVNLAHAGIEKTFHKLRDDASWRNNNKQYPVTLDYGQADVLIEDNSTDTTLGTDQLKLTSDVTLDGESRRVIYKVEIIYPQLPNIPGALALTDPNFSTNLFGSFDINGNDESGMDPVGLPGISVIDEPSKQQILDDGTEMQLDQILGNTGTPSIEVDQSMEFKDLADFISQLRPNAEILSGNYNSDLGNKAKPGVFFVEDYAKIAGNVNGYGILVVKSSGDLDLASVDLAGTFNFYGLVLFENSWSFDGTGTANIHGSVVVGSPENSSGVSVELGGNLNIHYNSLALDYARDAARVTIPASFKVLDIYE